MLDEMAIKKNISWVNGKCSGYVDMGSGLEDDSCIGVQVSKYEWFLESALWLLFH